MEEIRFLKRDGEGGFVTNNGGGIVVQLPSCAAIMFINPCSSSSLIKIPVSFSRNVDISIVCLSRDSSMMMKKNAKSIWRSLFECCRQRVKLPNKDNLLFFPGILGYFSFTFG